MKLVVMVGARRWSSGTHLRSPGRRSIPVPERHVPQLCPATRRSPARAMGAVDRRGTSLIGRPSQVRRAQWRSGRLGWSHRPKARPRVPPRVDSVDRSRRSPHQGRMGTLPHSVRVPREVRHALTWPHVGELAAARKPPAAPTARAAATTNCGRTTGAREPMDGHSCPSGMPASMPGSRETTIDATPTRLRASHRASIRGPSRLDPYDSPTRLAAQFLCLACLRWSGDHGQIRV